MHRLENEAITFDRALSYALGNARRLANGKLLKERNGEDDAVLKNRKLVLNPQANLQERTWYWPDAASQPADFTRPEEESLIMTLSLPELRMEEELDMFVGLVLHNFSGEGKEVSAVMEEAVAAFEVDNEEQKDHVRSLTLQQVREALESGILYYAEYNS